MYGKKMLDQKIFFSIAFIIALAISAFFFKNQRFENDISDLDSFEIPIPNQKYGFVLDTFNVSEGIIKENQYLADILLLHHVNYQQISEIANASKDVFDVTYLRAGKPFTILNRDTSTMADFFIYEPNAFRYIVYNIKHPNQTQVVERTINTTVKSSSGVVESSLWNAMIDNGMSFDLTARLEDAFAWVIDFHHIQKGDKFKLIYDEQYINGEKVGVGSLHAALYQTSQNDYYAIYFENEKHNGFFDLEGRTMKKHFLKSPVKFSRISSRFNRRRFHPVLKRVKAHLGTDYAAPRGTPIMATANGVVTKRGRTRGNGNYIKIKHNDTYSTQYLHMSKFAKGVTKGVQVKQGQTIGYVGSTGLATGPHVCYRFWKNGRQVNPFSLNLPPPKPMPEEDLPKYFKVRDSLKLQLDSIPYNIIQESVSPIETDSTNS